MRCTAALLTPLNPGAIAIIQLHGDVDDALAACGFAQPPQQRMKLADLAGIDEGLIARLDEHTAQIMPHGGVRVVQRILEFLASRGIAIQSTSEHDPRTIYPEANNEVEANMLDALARAASPLAIDLLLDQPRRWSMTCNESQAQQTARSKRLHRLVDPPLVVLAGPANVGKSTLSNALAGRDVAIAMDQPGTTRDYVSSRINLAGLVVEWRDTPGLRDTDDPIEAKAIELARRLMMQADLLIAMTDPDHDWPRLPRQPDLLILNKIDLNPTEKAGASLCISATTGEGLPALVQVMRDQLVSPEDLSHSGVWLFAQTCS